MFHSLSAPYNVKFKNGSQAVYRRQGAAKVEQDFSKQEALIEEGSRVNNVYWCVEKRKTSH